MADRLTKNTWIAHGFEVLRSSGHEAVKADTMCKALNVSRGSFYWHFSSLSDFHDALLAAWRVQNTEIIIAELKELPEPHLQLSELIKRAIDTPQPLENAMRRWGGANPKVAAALAEVDHLRFTFLLNLMVGLGVPEETAKDHAALLTWAFIGRSFAPNLVPETSDAFARDLSTLLLQSDPQA